MLIDDPGLYPDITEADYHADPVRDGSLSATELKRLMVSPATYRWYRDNPEGFIRHFNFGHAAHSLALGRGNEVRPLEFRTYNTKASQARRDEALDAGLVPLLIPEVEKLAAMMAELHTHPHAGPLFTGDPAYAETTAIWADPETGLMCRARWDYAKRTPAGRLLIVDYKTRASDEMDRLSLGKAMFNFRYHMSAAHYRAGARALGAGGDDTAFVLVFQSKEPPYDVTVGYVGTRPLEWGAVLNRKAIDVYRQCVKSGQWPGTETEVIELDLPQWAAVAYERANDDGAYLTMEDWLDD